MSISMKRNIFAYLLSSQSLTSCEIYKEKIFSNYMEVKNRTGYSSVVDPLPSVCKTFIQSLAWVYIHTHENQMMFMGK
jgi:hypothetical protein